MPKMYAYNTSATPIKKRYAMIGSTATQVKKRYAMIGSTATLVFSAEQVLADSGTLQMGPGGYGPGGNSYGAASSVKWDCRGFDTLSFTVNYTVDGNAEAYGMSVYIKSKSGTIVATVFQLYQLGPLSNIDISGLTEDEKSAMYMTASFYAYCGDWTNKWATLTCSLTNVIAS